MSTGTPARTYPSADTALGHRDSRFFGEGFKRVTHALTSISVEKDTIEATAGIRTPGTWSKKGDSHQRPHLSTLDAMLLGAQLTGLYTAHSFNHDNSGFSVTAVKVRAGNTPDEEQLDHFPVTARHLSTKDTPRGKETVMECHTGSMTVTVTARHNGTHTPDQPGHYPLPEHLPGTWNNAPYGADHHTRSQLLTDLAVDPQALTASGKLTINGQPRDGQHVTAIDLFVSVLQLAQVLLYDLDGLDRASSNTLWMRRTDITPGLSQETSPASQRLAIRLEDCKQLLTKEGTWRAARIHADHAGIALDCGVVHLLP
ncbi:AvrD family protein [Streptomyces rubiginosohelvolus]|uniref:AvrD family protein n=1 Tax=Streptomyces rubiginosohelvolus TaxID=67362 RepID=UPI0036B0521E